MYKSEQLRERTKQFTIKIVYLYRVLPNTGQAKVFARQLLRSASSVAANYRAVCRARSKAEFISKIGIVVEEIDESVLWLELLLDTGIVVEEKMKELLRESNELLAIFAASQCTVKRSVYK
jgi:four helix bundle protein